jgi:iron complex outermembrane receptor protein
MGNSAFSDRWIEDGSYLRLKNVTLSYKLPINNTYIQGITVWARATNVFTVTKYKGIDPEVYGGIDNNMYPRPFTLQVGVNLNF